MADDQEPVKSESQEESGEPRAEGVDPNPTPEPSTEAASSGDTTLPKSGSKQKIDILLKATGNAPIMKKKKWAVDPEKKIGWIKNFITQYLKLDSKENLFLYINQAFAPAPDQIVRNLYECYGTDGKLVLHYCKSPAWG